jgi:tetratricopeptide (TPR) repeat protein
LVFLNCCYLGKMGEPRPAGPDPRLAASLAEGFIQAGVRAVVAAGWAVQDAAGRTFARTFYERLFKGAAFGDAVKDARDATRDKHEQYNTWGAYQCYGNPDYRFRRKDGRRAASPAKRFVAQSEALQALKTLASEARSMQIEDKEKFTKRFDRLFTDISGGADKSKPDWTGHGEVLAACGEVLGELEEFDGAIDFYRKALATVPAKASFEAAEQLTNLLSRPPLRRSLSDEAMEAAITRFEDALNWLNWLDCKLQPTKERWSLRGALHKRWAICDATDRPQHLEKSAEAYAKAAALAGSESYQWQNALVLQYVQGSSAVLRSAVDDHVDKARQAYHNVDRIFWDIVALPDALLHKHLVYGTLAADDVLQALIKGYRDALAAGPSPKQWASVLDHIRFLAVMISDPKLPCHKPELADALNKVMLQLGL